MAEARIFLSEDNFLFSINFSVYLIFFKNYHKSIGLYNFEILNCHRFSILFTSQYLNSCV